MAYVIGHGNRIRFRVTPTGAIKVLRSDVESRDDRDRYRREPDLEAI